MTRREKIRVWVSRDRGPGPNEYCDVWDAHPTIDEYDRWVTEPFDRHFLGELAHANWIGVKPGECREFMLVPVKERKR